MSETTLFEYEATQTADEAAALLRELADGFAGGTTLTFGDDVVLDAPPRLAVAVEVEREAPDDGPPELEVELEFEWTPADATDADRAAAATDEGTDDTRADAGGENAAGSTATRDPPAAEASSAGDPSDDVAPDPVATPDATSKARFQLYRDRGGDWRWRLVHRNGNIIATSGEGYTSRRNARTGLRSVMTNAPNAPVSVEGEDDSDAEAEAEGGDGSSD